MSLTLSGGVLAESSTADPVIMLNGGALICKLRLQTAAGISLQSGGGLAEESIPHWWTLGNGFFAAYQAKGAVDQFYAKVDRTGNGRDLAFSPTWTKDSGWTSAAISQLQTLLPAAGTTGYTAAWRGIITSRSDAYCPLFAAATPETSGIWYANNLTMHCWNDGHFYAGHNTAYTSRLLPATSYYNTDTTFIYKKFTDNSQQLWINGVLVASGAGTSYTNQQSYLCTNAGCKAAGILHTTNIDAAELHAAMMAI